MAPHKDQSPLVESFRPRTPCVLQPPCPALLCPALPSPPMPGLLARLSKSSLGKLRAAPREDCALFLEFMATVSACPKICQHGRCSSQLPLSIAALDPCSGTAVWCRDVPWFLSGRAWDVLEINFCTLKKIYPELLHQTKPTNNSH